MLGDASWAGGRCIPTGRRLCGRPCPDGPGRAGGPGPLCCHPVCSRLPGLQGCGGLAAEWAVGLGSCVSPLPRPLGLPRFPPPPALGPRTPPSPFPASLPSRARRTQPSLPPAPPLHSVLRGGGGCAAPQRRASRHRPLPAVSVGPGRPLCSAGSQPARRQRAQPGRRLC